MLLIFKRLSCPPPKTHNRRSVITKKLEELFQLPESSDDEEEITAIQLPEDDEISEDALQTLDKIDMALPRVKGLEAADKEYDDLAEMAISSYKELMELGMNVEARHGPEIFNSASTMLGHAITARTNKVNKKLKQLDLMIKKAQLDVKIANKTTEVENVPIGEGKSLDRNELLKILTDRENPDSP